ncbi:MAG: site-2 protease family protein, partial [Acidimicrobiales bacterium]
MAVVVVAVLIVRDVVTTHTVLLLAVLFGSVILHEVSHGVVALRFGDDTAKRAGRLTLNPISHVDPFGTIILPVILVLVGSSPFGWAKPVPVNPSRMRSPRNHSLLVSLAGPATNIVLA